MEEGEGEILATVDYCGKVYSAYKDRPTRQM